MRVIVVPDHTGEPEPIRVSSRELSLFGRGSLFFVLQTKAGAAGVHWMMALALITVLVLPAALGVGAYYAAGRLDSGQHASSAPEGAAPEALVDHVREVLRQQGEAIESARLIADSEIEALGLRLGSLHAQVLRLNALGERLTGLSGLDTEEFDFDEEPAVGGAEGSLGSQRPDFIAAFEDISRQIDRNFDQLAVLEALIADQELDEEQHPSGWPSSGGWISSRYGYRRDPFTGRRAFHSGVDIANKPGSPIKAVADGVVTRAGREGAYGLMVEVNHGNGYHTRYAHASKILVDVGSRVSKGDRIAVVGSTGRSTGTHVHFEVFKDDKAVNPRKFLRAAR